MCFKDDNEEGRRLSSAIDAFQKSIDEGEEVTEDKAAGFMEKFNKLKKENAKPMACPAQKLKKCD